MTKKEQFQTLAGMKDILPAEQSIWRAVIQNALAVANQYGFQQIDTPILEPVELFQKGTGEETDIVQKEMFTFKTKGRTAVALRPEGTPSVVRAYLEHGMEKQMFPVKLCYVGPMFRHEKPQQGRRRQLHQFGLECIGEEDPIRDLQIIQAFFAIFEAFKISDVRLEVNTLGCAQCAMRYKKELHTYYISHIKQVCADCRTRHEKNPLRLLDCKDEKCQRAKIHAPQMLDFLCDDCRDHFTKLLEYLDVLDIPYNLNPHLVRGLDYYTHTVFEIFPGEIREDESTTTTEKRLALISGGRYDNLIQSLGGRSTPAVGGAMGIERFVAFLEQQNTSHTKSSDSKKKHIFLVQLGDKAKKHCLVLLKEMQKARINAHIHEAFGRDSISSQLKIADKVGASMAIIIGQKEVIDKVAIIREMNTGMQEIIPRDKLIDEIKKRIK